MIAAVKASAIANWVNADAFMVSLVGKHSLSLYQHAPGKSDFDLCVHEMVCKTLLKSVANGIQWIWTSRISPPRHQIIGFIQESL